MSFSLLTGHLPSTPSRNLSSEIPFRQCRNRTSTDRLGWKRSRRVTVPSSLLSSNSPFESLFQHLIVQFPSVNSLDLIAPALGFASGTALYLSRLRGGSRSYGARHEGSVLDIGEWTMFAAPTPFNRFLMLRCPSISFLRGQLMGTVNERLVKEESQFVRLTSGRIQVWNDEKFDEKLVYQRLCISMEDGGVVSLDWPENLDLEEERGLDTTCLIVPGTAEGSMNKDVRGLVCDCLKRGFFPVVMNPRGCAGSPLTTSRLFTAADSDDISTTVEFIKKRRPWSMFMGIGWGYSANMLTKYLAEVGEETPLMAATCIDNPFDLEVATRASPYLDQKLTPGLVHILQSNKELFQGRTKGFNVEKALLSTSIRDFEREISMVSYGFNSLEDFYVKSSTRDVIGRVKIPLLFIQNNDRSVPLFSVPQSSIAQNPYTSQLLCNEFPFTESVRGRSTTSWCQNLAMEWIAAVELALLKGRHPLLQDVDVTINSSSVPTMSIRSSDGNVGVKKPLNIPDSDSVDGPDLDPLKETVEEGNTAASQNTGFLLLEDNDTVMCNCCGDANSGEEEAESQDDRGQVLQGARVIMNMLDMTMPDTFTEEQKNKVLTAVSQGETVMNALQGAVPEDVRGKLTSAVSEIVHNQGSNLKLDQLLALKPIPYVTSWARVGGESSPEAENECSHSSDEMKVRYLPNGSNKDVSSADNHSSELGEGKASENLQKTDYTCEPQSINSCSDVEKDMIDLVHNNQNAHLSGKTGLASGDKGSESKAEVPPKGSILSEREAAIEKNMDSEKYKTKQDDGKTERVLNGESSSRTNEEDVLDSSSCENSAKPNTEENATSSASLPQDQVMEKMDVDNIKREEKCMQTNSNQSISDSPVPSASQALDALTGIDDSTQMAVNSVFHVLEDMITRLEDGKHDENKMQVFDNNRESEDVEGKYRYPGTPPSDAIPSNNQSDSVSKTKERQMIQDESGKETKHSAEKNWGTRENVLNAKLCVEDSAKYLNAFSQNVPIYSLKDLQGHSLHKENNQISKSEDSRQKIMEHAENDANSDKDVTSHECGYSQPKPKDIDIKSSYVTLDSVKMHDKVEKSNGNVEFGNAEIEKSSDIIRNIIVDTLRIEVGRRLSSADMEQMETELARDMENIANVVSSGVGLEDIPAWDTKIWDCDLERVGTLHGEHVVRAISSAAQNTTYLQRVLPVGLIVGSSLAALRKSFELSAIEQYGKGNEMILNQINQRPKDEKRSDSVPHLNANQKYELECSGLKADKRVDSEILSQSKIECRDDSGDSRKSIMVGAVTAALGASAFIVHHQGDEIGISSNCNEKEDQNKDVPTLEDVDKPQDNIVTSLAEKAMSIASPVVPTKDGEVDQERLVTMLAELGQKGGLFRFVGKFALLWGGLRGAMSLTDKLLSFLYIAERPLFQRIFAFMCMVLVLWSPVAVPLLPTLVLSWSTHSPFKTAELVCIVGLYISVMLLVTIWGKRIRGYRNPLELYGLDLTSLSKAQDFMKGLVGGVILVLLYYSVNSLVGSVYFHMPITFPGSSSAALASLKIFSQMVLQAFQGLTTATGVAVIEELLFRSWLPDEIASDLGYNQGIIISGLAFSVFQRSAWAVPGLWMLSLALSGLRKRNKGSLSLPIGVRAGILASNNFLRREGFLISGSKSPPWLTGASSFQPFSGATGLAFALLLAVLFYPRDTKKMSTHMKD